MYVPAYNITFPLTPNPRPPSFPPSLDHYIIFPLTPNPLAPFFRHQGGYIEIRPSGVHKGAFLDRVLASMQEHGKQVRFIYREEGGGC